ncbi:MAG: methyltransferase domain-containing protein [Acidimicrobiia bacterium]|nr:methyltransferase domain-containing protein [Acidimicrobiia bacterium]
MRALHPSPNPPWAAYLQRFHADRPGITERILNRCHADGIDPYQWCAQPLADRPGPILDLACGSGPMADRLHGWIGTDTSAAELGAARDRQRGPVMRASATRLPIRTGALDTATCSMGMQIIDPVAEALSELARVLRPGGRATLVLPAGGPTPWRHAVTYGRLQVALRQRIRYPNDNRLRPAALRQATTAVGLQVSDDERLAFTLPLDTAAHADELLTSIYLPGIDPARLDAGRRVLAGRIGSTLTVPLRRIVLERTEASG